MSNLLFKNTLYSAIDKVVIILIGFIFVAIMVKTIGPVQYGVFLILSMLSMTNALGAFDLGLGVSIQYFIAYYNKNFFRKKVVIAYSILLYTFLGLLVSFLLYAFSNQIALSIDYTEISHDEILYMLKIITINLFFQFLMLAFKSILEGERFFYLTNILNSITAILQAFIIILSVSFTSSLNHVFEIILFITILKMLILAYWVHKYILKTFDMTFRLNARNLLIFKKILKYSLDIFGNRLVGFINNQTDKILIWKYLNPIYMAIYDIVTKPILPLRLIVQVLNNALIPEVTKHYKQKEYSKIISIYHNFVNYSYILILPISFFLFFYIDLILGIWIGEAYMQYSNLSIVVIFTYLLFPISAIASSIVTGLHAVRKMLKYIVFAAILNLVLSLLLVQYMGIIGLLIATLISSYLLVVPYINIIEKTLLLKTDIYKMVYKIFLIHTPILIMLILSKFYLEIGMYSSLWFALCAMLIQYYINYKFLLQNSEKVFLINMLIKRKK